MAYIFAHCMKWAGLFIKQVATRSPLETPKMTQMQYLHVVMSHQVVVPHAMHLHKLMGTIVIIFLSKSEVRGIFVCCLFLSTEPITYVHSRPVN